MFYNIVDIFQITDEIFKQPKQRASVRVWQILSHLHSFINYIWTTFTYMISDHWPPFGSCHWLRVCPASHHMMLHLMIALWITGPSLTHESEAWSSHYSAEGLTMNGIQIQSCSTIPAFLKRVPLTLEDLSEYSFMHLRFLCTHVAFVRNRATVFLYVQECRPGALPVLLRQRAQRLHWS